MCYIPLLPLQFSFLRFSIQLERKCSPPRHAFPSSRLVFPRGIRNFLAITYWDNFLIFKLHGLQPFCFPPSWWFRWPVQWRGIARDRMFSMFQSQQEFRSYFSEGKSVLFPERYSVWERLVVNLVFCAWVVPEWRGFVLMPSFMPYWFAQLPEPEVFRWGEI